MTRKTAIQSNGDLKRSGMPSADSQYKLLREGIQSGDLTRLDELTKFFEDLEASIDVNSREGRQALGDFSLAFRECGRAARAAAKEEDLTDNKGQLRISLWPWLVPARQLPVPYDEKLCVQVIGELKQHGMLRDVKVRNAPQVALDLVRKQPKDSYDRETSLRTWLFWNVMVGITRSKVIFVATTSSKSENEMTNVVPSMGPAFFYLTVCHTQITHPCR